MTHSRKLASSISTCRRRRIACGRRSRRRRTEEAIMYAFEYQRANSVAEAAAAVAKTGGKLLAGGQSLVVAMRLRLANPGAVIDLSGISELKGIRKEGDAVVVGATTTHAEVASSSVVKQTIPALAALAESIGDRQVRN